mgnify:CR=1 FL=1
MKTTFALWLEARGEAHYAYADRRGLGRRRVALYAGVGPGHDKVRGRDKIKRFDYASLSIISQDTGIPLEMLIKDAIAALEDPTPPRRYTRKATANTTEAKDVGT